MRNVCLGIILGLAALHALPAFAGTIESEPLPPPPGQQGSAGLSTPAPIPSNSGPIPITPRSGTSIKPAPQAATDPNDDSGMSGTTGGTSAYDLGKPSMPAAKPTNIQPVPQTTAPHETVQDVPMNFGRSGTRMGIAPPENIDTKNKKFCNLKVVFNSIGTGIDHKVANSIKTYLDANADKLSYVRANWGREGEYTYCLEIPQHKNRSKIYTELKRLLPAKGEGVSSTELSGGGFTSVTTAR